MARQNVLRKVKPRELINRKQASFKRVSQVQRLKMKRLAREKARSVNVNC